MHAIELERKLRLPDPSKAMEGMWKLLKRTRQQLNTHSSKASIASNSPSETLSLRRRAKVEAERQKARGLTYALRTTIR